jgi:hypothetical protein
VSGTLKLPGSEQKSHWQIALASSSTRSNDGPLGAIGVSFV